MTMETLHKLLHWSQCHCRQSTSNSECVLDEFKDNSDNRIIRAATTVFSTLGASLKHAMRTASMLYLRPAYLTSSYRPAVLQSTKPELNERCFSFPKAI